MSILTDELEDIVEDLEDAKDAVGQSPGPLAEPAYTTVRIKLINAQTHIENVISLTGNAGAHDSNNLPGTLPAIAAECLTLANAALTEGRKANPNNTIIGNKVKTINRIIDVTLGYRDRAGIT